MNKIIELQQDFYVLQEAWHKLFNQLQTLDSVIVTKLDIQAIENKLNKIQLDIVNLRTEESSQDIRTQKLADAHKWMDSHYHKTFERLVNE